MQNVTAIHAAVNEPTVEDVVTWIEAQASKGDMPENSARLRVTALRALAALVAPDEPSHAAAIVEHVDRLERRWATKHPDMKGDTARTYSSRARTSIEEFLRWRDDPAGYRPRQVEKSVDRPREKKEKTTEGHAPTSNAGASGTPPSPPTNAVASSTMRTFPLGGGRLFVYGLPLDGLRIQDVKKLMFHLVTMAEDFTGDETPQQALALNSRS